MSTWTIDSDDLRTLIRGTTLPILASYNTYGGTSVDCRPFTQHSGEGARIKQEDISKFADIKKYKILFFFFEMICHISSIFIKLISVMIM